MPKLTPTDIQQLRETRVTAPYLLQTRNGRNRNAYYFDWKQRLSNLDLLYRGDWTVLFPNETSKTELPKVMNLVQVGLDDISRLASSTIATTRVEPETDSEDDHKLAKLREAAYATFWHRGKGNLLMPALFMDLAGTGTSFLRVKQGQMYPEPFRIDPRGCFPTFVNGKLQDLLVVERMVTRDAERKFGKTLNQNGKEWELHTDWVEIIEYYDDEEIRTIAVGALSQNADPLGPIQDISSQFHDLGRPPVAAALLDSFDGHFRGMFDQLAGMLGTQNRIFTLMLDYADRIVYAPKVARDVENAEQPEGPNVVYKLGDTGSLARLAPAGSSPELFTLLEYLERQSRGGAGYPAQRQGQVNQAIASASFVSSTQGQLTTQVDFLQEKIGSMRQDWNEMAACWDERYMDTGLKPLVRPVGQKRNYRPSSTWRSDYMNRVTYGIGAGLDKLNQRVAVIQAVGSGLLSKELAMEQLEEITDPIGEMQKIEKETVKQMFLEKTLPTLPPEQMTMLVAKMAQGVPFDEAILVIQQMQQAQAQQQAAMQPQQAPGEVGRPAEPQTAADQLLALQKGQQAPAQPAGSPQDEALKEFASMNPPASENIMIRPGYGQG